MSSLLYFAMFLVFSDITDHLYCGHYDNCHLAFDAGLGKILIKIIFFSSTLFATQLLGEFTVLPIFI